MMEKLSDIWIDKIDGEDYVMANDPENGGINQIARQVIKNTITISSAQPESGIWLKEV